MLKNLAPVSLARNATVVLNKELRPLSLDNDLLQEGHHRHLCGTKRIRHFAEDAS